MTIRETIIAEARAWIGTPYLHQASTPGAGCDCLGLVRGVWRALRGAEPATVPPYGPDWAETGGDEALWRALAAHLRPAGLLTQTARPFQPPRALPVSQHLGQPLNAVQYTGLQRGARRHHFLSGTSPQPVRQQRNPQPA